MYRKGPEDCACAVVEQISVKIKMVIIMALIPSSISRLLMSMVLDVDMSKVGLVSGRIQQYFPDL